MNIVVALLSGNEVELIDAFIKHHLALGVSGIVIADLGSTDGTVECLKLYANDPRILLRFYGAESLWSPEGLKLEPVWAWTLEAARAHFRADWVLRIDTDEFLLPRGGDLQASFAQHAGDAAISVPRYNAIFPKGPPAVFSGPGGWGDLLGQEVVAVPHRFTSTAYAADDRLPLILTAVMPKVAVRPEQVVNFTIGGHGAVAAERREVPAAQTMTLALVHFWITSFTRFSAKAETLVTFERNVRPLMPPGAAWQWGHWARIAMSGPAAMAAEYHRQFLSEALVAELRGVGALRRAEDLWGET